MAPWPPPDLRAATSLAPPCRGFLNLLTRLGVAEVAARRNARRFFRLKRRTPIISLSCVRQHRIIEVRDDALVQAVEQMLHGHGYRLAEAIHFRIEPL